MLVNLLFFSRIVCVVAIISICAYVLYQALNESNIYRTSSNKKSIDAQRAHDQLKTNIYKLAAVAITIVFYRFDKFETIWLTIVYYFITVIILFLAQKVTKTTKQLIIYLNK